MVSAAPGRLGAGGISFSASGGSLTVGAVAGGASGFGGNGTGWILNGSSPVINNDVLTITPNSGGQANSVIFNQPVSTHNFTASFAYTDVTGGGADGFTLMLENDLRGTTALGGAGGSLGYGQGTPILNSVALEGNIYGGNTIGIGLGSNGSTGAYTGTGSVNLAATNTPVNVSLSYSDSTDTLTVQLTQGTNSYQTSYANCGLQANVGPFAYLGITGGTGGLQAQQNISNFTYSSTGALATYTNNLSVAAGSSGNNLVANVNVAATSATPTVTMGNLTMGAYSTLNVAPDASTSANINYGLTLGEAALSGATTFNVANNGTGTGVLTLTGVVSGASGSVTKTGSGKLVLTGANTYAGGTTVNAGLLAASGTAVPGAIAVNSGGAFSPGVAVGSATTGAATWNSGGKYSFEIDTRHRLRGLRMGLVEHRRQPVRHKRLHRFGGDPVVQRRAGTDGELQQRQFVSVAVGLDHRHDAKQPGEPADLGRQRFPKPARRNRPHLPCGKLRLQEPVSGLLTDRWQRPRFRVGLQLYGSGAGARNPGTTRRRPRRSAGLCLAEAQVVSEC